MNGSAASGVPVLVDGADDQAWLLERVSLTPKDKGTFDEAWLQRLIHRAPACLPIAEIEPGLDPFVAVCREMPTARGPLDNLLMTRAGDIAIVETKLFRNPEARRQVVAQTLDYATAVFDLGYDAFERQVLQGAFDGSKPASLFAAVHGADAAGEGEASFVDAVAGNLRGGRALVLIVGDGIRAEAEALAAGLHAHARYGFRLALVELAVFRMPGENGQLLVRPSTLARSEVIQRTVVETRGADLVVREARPVVSETIEAGNYWEALEAKVPGARAALEAFIQTLEPVGVYPELLGSLNLKWRRPGEKPVNLGYIFKHASLWTDAAAWFAPKDLARCYVEDVAQAFDAEVHELPKGNAWTPYKDGKPLRLSDMMGKLERWRGPMERFVAAIQASDLGASDPEGAADRDPSRRAPVGSAETELANGYVAMAADEGREREALEWTRGNEGIPAGEQRGGATRSAPGS